ncbi:MAG: hypothetical protein VR74_10670 [Hyphomonas sp. BRH_c22]|uniref:sulfotransferase family protein n=1 Tax=Hyphomonas sp. BRH_c22 TaxID=1629710 RepID=UPI0005F15984|nr:sulfotransferase family protein [Hyphomonas sp. BRH_c22]KJS36961.1 MAG: hypothetical protein VR74_10670 [Hyphomonas sp. BRH_c22]
MQPRKFAFSCVVDEHTKFLVQLNVWLATLTENAGVKPADIFVHIVYDDPRLSDRLETLGVNCIAVPKFGDQKYCNKISQLDTEALREYDYVVLCDADLAFIEDPRPHIPELKWAVAGCPVDFPNPSWDTIRTVAEDLGIKNVSFSAQTIEGFPTLSSNLNGGLYVLPGNMIAQFRSEWRRLALEMLANEACMKRLGESHEKHVDQLSFAFSCMSLGTTVTHLPRSMNFPLHLNRGLYETISLASQPVICHVHDQYDWRGHVLTPDGMPFPEVIVRANAPMAHPLLFNDAEKAPKGKARRKISRPSVLGTPKAVVITGFHRSGTSLIGGAMRALGMWFDDEHLIPGDDDNPKGYFEDARVVQLNGRLLETLNQHWATPAFDIINPQHTRKLMDEYVAACDILKNFNAHSNAWVIKDPRISLTLPVWRDALRLVEPTREFYQITLLRDPMACAVSQQKRNSREPGYRNDLLHITGADLDETLMSWITHNISILEVAALDGADRVSPFVVPFSEVLSDPAGTLDAMACHLNCKLAKLEVEKYVESFVDPTLNRSDKIIAPESAETFWAIQANKLYELLLAHKLKAISRADAKVILKELHNVRTVLLAMTPLSSLMGKSFRVWKHQNVQNRHLTDRIKQLEPRAASGDTARLAMTRLAREAEEAREAARVMRSKVQYTEKVMAGLVRKLESLRSSEETLTAFREVFGPEFDPRAFTAPGGYRVIEWAEMKRALSNEVADLKVELVGLKPSDHASVSPLAEETQRHIENTVKAVKRSARYRVGNAIVNAIQVPARILGIEPVLRQLLRSSRTH